MFQLRYTIANGQPRMPADKFCLKKCKKLKPCKCDNEQWGKGNGPPGKKPKGWRDGGTGRDRRRWM